MSKPNCYKCKYRVELPGSAHSKCKHPEVVKSGLLDNPLAGLFSIYGGVPPLNVPGINVKGHPRGIECGWFAWPLNFDPVWLLSCNGFEEV